jgi:protein TonB
MNDIVFENRNKSYGAYALRSAYERIMARSMLSGFIFFICGISSPFVYNIINVKDSTDIDIVCRYKEITLENFSKQAIIIPKAASPKLTQPLLKNLIKSVTPAVVPDEIVIENIEVPSVESLHTNAIGNTSNTAGRAPEGPEIVGDPDEGFSIMSMDVEPGVFNSFAVQQQPQFPDGMAAMYKYLQKNLKYPQLAIETGLSGTVYIQFVVSKNGDILDAIVLRGIGGGLDQEALRVIKLMPPWTPGKHNGKPVSVIFTLPIKFQLLK